MLIYKIFRRSEWADFEATGETDGAPIDIADGFIHFSSADTVRDTAALHFQGENGLMLVAVEADTLDALKWEPSRGGTLFPHLFRPLRQADVVWAKPLPLNGHAHQFPEDL